MCLSGCAITTAPRSAQLDGRRHPSGLLSASVSQGDFHSELFSSTTGASLGKAHSDAQAFKLSLEGVSKVTGGGFSLEILSVDDDLNRQINPGTVRSTDVSGFDFFGHLTIRPTGGEIFRMPIRTGLFIDRLSLEDTLVTSGTQTTDYAALGLRLELEPEFDLWVDDRMALSVYAKAAVGVGVAGVSLETATDDETFDTLEQHRAFGVGVRFRASRFHTELGYVYKHRDYRQTDPEVFNGSSTTLDETQFTFSGFMISMGFRW